MVFVLRQITNHYAALVRFLARSELAVKNEMIRGRQCL